MGTAAAAGTAAVFAGALRERFGLAWDAGPAAPLALRELTLVRGHLPADARAILEVRVLGPGVDEPVYREELTLSHARVTRPVALSYAHPRLVPGRWRYVARLSAGDQHAECEIGYTLRRFVFGV